MQTNEVKTAQVKIKAKKFLAVNKYHPLFLYAAFLAIVVLFAILITAVAANLVFLIFLVFVAVAIFLCMGGIVYSVSEFYLRSYNLKYEERFSLFEGYKKENFARATLIHLIKVGIGLLGLILFIAPGVIFLLRTSMTSFILRDNPDMKPWDAIKESNNLLKGHHMQFFKFFAAFIGWFLLGIVSFGGVLIYVIPYYCTSKSIFYHNILLELNDDDLSILYNYKLNSNSVSKERIVNDEILSIEKKIKEMQRAKAIAIEAEKLNIANIKANAELEFQKESMQNPLLMEKVENVTSILDVEEIPLPELEPNQLIDANKKYFAHSGDTFASSEIEIMEGESFDDFRKRISNLRDISELEKKKKRQPGKFVQSIYNEGDKPLKSSSDENAKGAAEKVSVQPNEKSAKDQVQENNKVEPNSNSDKAAADAKIIADKLASEKLAKLEAESKLAKQKTRDLELGFAEEKLDVNIIEDDDDEIFENVKSSQLDEEILDNNVNKNNLNHMKSGAYTRSGAYGSSTEIGATRGDIKKLSRTELIEKLRKDREAKNK